MPSQGARHGTAGADRMRPRTPPLARPPDAPYGAGRAAPRQLRPGPCARQPGAEHPNDEEVTVNQQTKACSKCGETKAITEFYANRNPSHGRPGVKSACKDCEKAVARAHETAPKPPLPTREELRRWYLEGCRVA